MAWVVVQRKQPGSATYAPSRFCRSTYVGNLPLFHGSETCRQQSMPLCAFKRFIELSFSTQDQLAELQFMPRLRACTALAANSNTTAAGSQVEDDNGQLLEFAFEEQQQAAHVQHCRTDLSAQQLQQLEPVAHTWQGQLQGTSHRSKRQGLRPPAKGTVRHASKGCTEIDRKAAAAAAQGTAAGNAPQQAAIHNKQQAMQNRHPHTKVQRLIASGGDDYAAAQQRVRELLIAADVHNTQAAADALPNTVNDIVIALQLLATAPKPSGLAAIKKYEAATQQLAAAVIQKFKQLMLQAQQQDRPDNMQQQQTALSHAVDTSNSPGTADRTSMLHHSIQPGSATVEAVAAGSGLAAALVNVPPTKLAAVTFSLGVLRHYDTELVLALEQASYKLLLHGRGDAVNGKHASHKPEGDKQLSSSSSNAYKHLPQQQQQQQRGRQQQHGNRKLPCFNANQLGQLVQGFVYLDHPLTCMWQQAFLQACKQQLQYMRGAQLASLGAFVVQYRTGTSTCTSSSSSSSSAGQQCGCMDVAWIDLYLLAAAQQTSSMKPQHLVQVLQAAACLFQQHQQQPRDGSNISKVFQGLPLSVTSSNVHVRRSQAAAGQRQLVKQNSSKSIRCSSSSKDWLLPLLAAVVQQLPDFKMNHLAEGLAAFKLLTTSPWPDELLQPLLLQLRLLLPTATGPDTVTAAAGVAALSKPSTIAANAELCDALLQRLHALLPMMSPQDLASVVSAVAVLQLKPYRTWLYELFARLRVEAKYMTAQEVIAVLEGLATLRVPLDPEVLHLFVLGVGRWIGVLSSIELRRIVAALRLMYPRVLPGRTVAQLVAELERRAGMLEMQGP